MMRSRLKIVAIAISSIATIAVMILTSSKVIIPASLTRNSAKQFRLESASVEKDIESCRMHRLSRLEERCYGSGYQAFTDYDQYSEKEIRKLVEYVIVDHMHRILLLSVPKSGCSSWKSVLLMSMENTVVAPHSINNWTLLAEHGLTRLKLEPHASTILRALKHYQIVLTVRHPFTRLESAYRSKFLHHNKFFKRHFSGDIIRHYRYNDNITLATNHKNYDSEAYNPAPDELNHYDGYALEQEDGLVQSNQKRSNNNFNQGRFKRSYKKSASNKDKHLYTRSKRKIGTYPEMMKESYLAKEINHSSKIDTESKNARASPGHPSSRQDDALSSSGRETPTFEEFLRYVIDRHLRPMNRHWDAYEEIAHPCALRFSYIAKTETADVDMDYVSSHLLNLGHLHVHKNQHGLSQEEATMADLPLFEALPSDIKYELAKKIGALFKSDMRLFGYDVTIDKRTGELKVTSGEFGPDDTC